MEEGTEEAFFDWTIETLRSVNGELGGLWHNTDTPIYFYRSDLVETPPATWSELRTAAEAFVAENPDQYFFTTPVANWFQTNAGMYVAMGGELVNDEGAPVLFEEGNRELWVEMFEFHIGLAEDDLMPGEAAVNNHNDQMPLMYANDVISFIGNNNMHIRALQPNLPPGEFELWDAAPLPRPDAADQGRYVAGGWVIALVDVEDEARQEAAANWVLHATDFNALRDTNKAGGWVPTRPAVIEEDPFYSEDPFMVTTLNALNEGGYVRPFAPIIGVINEQMSVAMSSALSGEATIDEALNAAEDVIMSEYEALTSN
jgi:multiple sugar transport system substrate-binding protein